MQGSYYVLSELSIWALAAILIGMLRLIVAGRDVREGAPYDVAASSYIGDYGLAIVVLIAATILHRSQAVPSWLESGFVHAAILCGSVLMGAIICASTIGSREGRLMDAYHDIVVAPTFTYLAVTLLPVIFKNGTWGERTATICFIALWAALVVYDKKHGRINQRPWLRRHGVIAWK